MPSKKNKNKNPTPPDSGGDGKEKDKDSNNTEPEAQAQADDENDSNGSMDRSQTESGGVEPQAREHDAGPPAGAATAVKDKYEAAGKPNLQPHDQDRGEDDVDQPSDAAGVQGKHGTMGKDDMASSMDYSDTEDPDGSMFHVLKPSHVPGAKGSHPVPQNPAHQDADEPVSSSLTSQPGTQQQRQQQQKPLTDSRTQHTVSQQQQKDPLKSVEGGKIPGSHYDTEKTVLSSSSSFENIPDEGESGMMNQHVLATTNLPTHSMVPTKADTSDATHTPQCSNFKIIQVFGDYMLEVGQKKPVKFPSSFKTGKNIKLDKNFVKDEDGTIFQIKQKRSGKIIITLVEAAGSASDEEEPRQGQGSLPEEQPSPTASLQDERCGQKRPPTAQKTHVGSQRSDNDRQITSSLPEPKKAVDNVSDEEEARQDRGSLPEEQPSLRVGQHSKQGGHTRPQVALKTQVGSQRDGNDWTITGSLPGPTEAGESANDVEKPRQGQGSFQEHQLSLSASQLGKGDGQTKPPRARKPQDMAQTGDDDQASTGSLQGATCGEPQDNSDTEDGDTSAYNNRFDSDENDEKPADDVEKSYDMVPEFGQPEANNTSDNRDDHVSDGQSEENATRKPSHPSTSQPETKTIKSQQGTDSRNEPSDKPTPAPRKKKIQKGDAEKAAESGKEESSSPDQPREVRWSSLTHGADAQDETFKVEVMLSEPDGTSDSLILLCQQDLYLRMQFMFKYLGDFAGKLNKLVERESFILQLDNGAVSIAKKGVGMNYRYCISCTVENVLKCTQNLSTNSVPIRGLETETLLNQIQEYSQSAGLKMFACFDKSNEYLLCVYPSNCAKEAEDCRKKVIRSLCLQMDTCECPIVYADVFTEEFVKVLKEEHPDVTFVTNEDYKKNTFVVLFKGEESQKQDAKEMWRKHTEKFSLNLVSFGDVKYGEKFENLSELLEKELEMERQTLYDEQNQKMYYSINNEPMEKITICTESQPLTDKLSCKIKNSLNVTEEIAVPTDIDVESCQQKIIALLNASEEHVRSTKFEEGKINITGSRFTVRLLVEKSNRIIKDMRNIQRAKQQFIKSEEEWTLSHGHCIKVSNLPVEKLNGDLIVTLLPDDRDAAAEALPDTKTCFQDTSVKITKLLVPKFGLKAKDRMTQKVQQLMDFAFMEDSFNIVIVVEDKPINGWTFRKLIKSIVASFKEHLESTQSHPVVTTFACCSTDVYNECSKIWDDGKEGPDIEEERQGGNFLRVKDMVELEKVALHECKVDVIVNSVDKSLDLNLGHVSKTILTAAGPEMQKEVNKKCPRKCWDIIESPAFKLPNCKMVLHGVLSMFRTAHNLQELKNFVFTCLVAADKRHFESIALPALGTGNLGYPRPDVARVMFEAVQKFIDEPNRQGFLQKVVFVLFTGDPDTMKAFEKEQLKYVGAQAKASTEDRSDPSERLTIGKLKLQASQGYLKKRSADVLIYLWHKVHMNNVKVSEHPLLKNLPSKVRADWATTRDSAKHQKYAPFTTPGGDFADEIVHMPCDNCSTVRKNLMDALILAEESRKNHVMVYFNKDNPLIKTGSTALPDQVLQALQGFAGMKDHTITDVTILTEDERLYNSFRRQFSDHQKKFPATATPNAEALTEPTVQTISGRGATDVIKDGMSATQRDHSKLQSSALETYVVLKNIPKNYTEEKFKASLVRPGFPVRPPAVVYSRSMGEAVLKCHNETEAAQLLLWTFADGMTASRPSQNLQSPKALLPEDTTKKLNKKESFPKLVKEFAEQDIHITQENGKLMIKTQTLCQMSYAKDKLADILEITGKLEPDLSGFEDISLEQTMPENNFKIFTMLRSNEINAFKKQGGKVSFDGVQVIFTRPSTIGIPRDLLNFAEEISSQQAEDIDIEKKWLADASKWCYDLTDSTNNTWCIYEPDTHKIIACCKSYDDLNKVKHRLNVLQEKVKVTGRRQRQMGSAEAAAPQHQQHILDKGSDSATSLARAGEFQWSRDSSNLEIYKTDEGIQVYVYNASIVKLPVDCIVNAANEMLQHGGGIAKVIEDAAGPALTRESDDYIKMKDKIPVGMCCTTTAGKLPFKRVIHTVGPRWYDYHPHTLQKVKECEEKLYMAIMNTLYEAEKEGMQSVAVPAISSAIFGVPEEICTYQYAKATIDYSRKCKQGENTLKEVHFVDINAKIIKQIQKRFDAFIISGNSPDYDIRQFVKKSDFRSSRREDYSHEVQSPKPHFNVQPMIFERKENEKSCFNVGENNELFIYSTNIFRVQSHAVVCVISTLGEPSSRIAFEVKKNINSLVMRHYDKQRKPSSSWDYYKPGQVVITDGFGCGFQFIIHVVFPGDMDTSRPDKKRKILKDAYTNILKRCQERKDIKSVALSHLGTDHYLSTEVFFDVYLEFCQKKSTRGRPLQLHFVCFEMKGSDIIYAKFHEYFQRMNASDLASPHAHTERASGNIVSAHLYPESATSDNRTETKADNSEWAGKTDVDERLTAGRGYKDYHATVTDSAEKDSEEMKVGEKESCVICMDDMTNPKTIPCGHKFCSDCIDQLKNYKPVCPTCSKPFGIIRGDQPDGTMRDFVEQYKSCTGYEGCGTITILYRFPSGLQKENHPAPGTRYEGIQRNAYLPDNRQGNIVLEMLKVAWNRKLVFTIGASRTTGQEGVITWNDIHHKTNMAPHGKFGYPDPDYLQRVTEELGAKGVKEEDIPGDIWREINRRFPTRV